jgi:hypothetical protein
MDVFEGLIHTIVFNALLQYGMDIPEVMRTHNLFTMDSDIVLRSKVVNSSVSELNRTFQ